MKQFVFRLMTQYLNLYYVLLLSVGNMIYGDQAIKRVLGHIWLTVGTLDLWNYSVIILMWFHLLTESTFPPPPLHINSLDCGIRAVTVGKAKKQPQDYINSISL